MGEGSLKKRRPVNDRIRENASDDGLGGRADLVDQNAENVEANEQIRRGDEKTTNVVCQVRETVVTRKRTDECVEASEKEAPERLGNNAKRVNHTTKHTERQDCEKKNDNEGRNEQTKDVETRKNDAQNKRGVVGITGGDIEAIKVTLFSAGNNSNASEYASPEQRNDVTNTTHTDEKKDASKSCNKKGDKNLTDTNEAFNHAIRKVLEGKPFICPLCNKGFSSRNGLRHHYYKTHQNSSSDQNTTMHLYYCHKCKEGFKTKKKFWLHDVKVHGLIETSSDESDSEIGAGQRVITTNATDESKEDVTHTTRSCEIENDLRTNRDDTGVEKVDGRLVIQSKITDWFRSK